MLSNSTSVHPQTYEQMERTNQILEDALRVIAMELQGLCDDDLDHIEFSYNNSETDYV